MGEERFLEPTYGCESDDEIIVETARKLAMNQQDKERVAKKFFEFVRDSIEYALDPVVGALKTLERKTGACVDKSSLLIALCRAMKIPARYVLMVAELLPKKDIGIEELPHCVVEIKIDDEWKIVDPTFDQGLKSIFPVSNFENPKWWKDTSPISRKFPEITKSEADYLSESYTTDETALKLKEVVEKAREV